MRSRRSSTRRCRRNAKELLVLTGERPEVNAEVAERLRSYGHEDFVSYVAWACERALERGLLPHTNLGALGSRGPGAASRGDGLAGPHARIDLRAPDGDGPRRLADEAPGGPHGDDRRGRRAPHPVHVRDPRRHRRDGGGADRLARGAGRLARPPRPHPGGDPPELRPAPALLRPGGRRHRRRGREAPVVERSRGARRGAADAGVGVSRSRSTT